MRSGKERVKTPFDDRKIKTTLQATTLLWNTKTSLYHCHSTARMAGDNEEISHEVSNGTVQNLHLNNRFNEQNPEGMGRNYGMWTINAYHPGRRMWVHTWKFDLITIKTTVEKPSIGGRPPAAATAHWFGSHGNQGYKSRTIPTRTKRSVIRTGPSTARTV